MAKFKEFDPPINILFKKKTNSWEKVNQNWSEHLIKLTQPMN